jgi:isopentenyl-diphosphate Delta-isomerase
MEQVILVDEGDYEVGCTEKHQAHVEGRLHRAFSIFIFDSKQRLLLQKRAKTKYHSADLWSNTCCGHPRPGESTQAAAHRRLKEEMNFDCELQEVFGFLYRVEFENKLIEHEYDHVLVGEFNSVPVVNKSEVQAWRWLSLEKLLSDSQRFPQDYTYWLRMIIGENASKASIIRTFLG